MLADAIEICHGTLTFITKADNPLQWAMAQDNLGSALQNQAIRTKKDITKRPLTQALEAYRSALEIFS